MSAYILSEAEKAFNALLAIRHTRDLRLRKMVRGLILADIVALRALRGAS